VRDWAECDGELGARPGEALWGGALSRFDTIEDVASVETVGGELGDRRVHAVLRVEEVGLDAGEDEALEQTQREPLCLGLFARDRGRKLAVIPHQHELLATLYHGHDRGELRGLGGLVDEHPAES
jgi:hypothetical protein